MILWLIIHRVTCAREFLIALRKCKQVGDSWKPSAIYALNYHRLMDSTSCFKCCLKKSRRGILWRRKKLLTFKFLACVWPSQILFENRKPENATSLRYLNGLLCDESHKYGDGNEFSSFFGRFFILKLLSQNWIAKRWCFLERTVLCQRWNLRYLVTGFKHYYVKSTVDVINLKFFVQNLFLVLKIVLKIV